MELEIINKNPIPKLHTETTSTKPQTYRSVSADRWSNRFNGENQHAYKNYTQ